MRKLNNKGITTIEVIICFVLIVIVTMSMYSTISYFNEKRLIEGYKEKIYNYKDLLTKDIQDDFIKIGLTHADYQKNVDGNVTRYIVNCTMKDGTNRQLLIEQTLGKSSYHLAGLDADDYFMVKYGKKNGNETEYKYEEYPIPELGFSKQNNHKIQDLCINNIYVDISDNNILSIYIGFYHPDLSTRYGVNIVAPIDYVTDGGLETGPWNY